MSIAPNRVAVYLTAVAGLCTALAPAVANLDVTSTVGAVGGLAAVAAVVDRWLKGWQADEARKAAGLPSISTDLADELTGLTEGVKATGPVDGSDG